STRKFIKMMRWGGVASVVAGALTGSWFGNALTGVTVFEKLKIYDPLKRPEFFLYFSVRLGYIQVLFGLFLSAGQKFVSGDIKSSIYEDMPWIIILLAVPLYFVGGVFQYLGKYLAYGGLAAVVFLSGFKSKSMAGKFFSGLYNLYGGTDYLKDMISYSRLFALGMGTGILAMAINEITKFGVDSFGWIGYIAAPFILIIGHLIINLLMSSLSAYVHTSRLQYVEFFTKFFKGGGRAFSPFSWRKKRVDIKW
ncbi:MAG: hypothetical protein PF545_06620, partial [Elusimicrobia bacterium]|nr:hypothetical protein [Elusimicrobiota bacterium]